MDNGLEITSSITTNTITNTGYTIIESFDLRCSVCGERSFSQSRHTCSCNICKTCGSEFTILYRKSRDSCSIRMTPLIMQRCMECMSFNQWEGQVEGLG